MKNLFWILLALILLAGTSCQDKQAMAELDELKAKSELEEQNKELLRSYYVELDNTKSDELATFIDKFVSSEFVLHLPGGIDINGKEGFEEYYASSKEAFPDAAHTVDNVIAEKDKVAFRATSKGMQQGEFMGIQPNDNEINVTFAGFWRVQDGKIVEWWSEYDALGMMQQLGMELQMKE